MGVPKGTPKHSNAGRKVGSLNKRTFRAQELAESLGVDPLEVLLRAAKGDWEGLGYKEATYLEQQANGAYCTRERLPMDIRVNAAKAAAPYIYSQNKSVDLTSEGQGFRVMVLDYTDKDKKPE